MFERRGIRMAFSAGIVITLFSQSGTAALMGTEAARTATVAKPLISEDHAEAIYRHLIESHWTPRTGLFRAYPDSEDRKLSQQASTYEQAAMGLLSIQFGDLDRAKQLVDFFKNAWDSGPNRSGTRGGIRGLVNFYNADFGTEGIEKTIHVGPNAWVGLFAAKYANLTKDREALQLALDIQYWIANVIPHQKGGVAMGLRDDPYGASWSRIYSTENNLSYYTFLTELLRSPGLDKSVRIAVTAERDHVENWLTQVAFDRKLRRMRRGFNPQGPDSIQALDTVTWLVSAIGPARLADRGIDADRLMRDAEKTFEVSVGPYHGVDPTDQEEANRTYDALRQRPDQINRPPRDAHRVIWFEGLGQYILAWGWLADEARHRGDDQAASAYAAKAHTLMNDFDQAALKRYPGRCAYPYATPGLFFRFGWGAPKEGDDGPAGSLIAGIWRCFAGLGFDPMAGRDLPGAPRVAVRVPEDIHLAERKPAVLFGTSEDMTTEAWRALRAQDWDHAIEQAKATIQEWASAARFLQRKKMREVGHLVDYSGNFDEKRTIFQYWALNDVAAAYYILGQAYDKKGDYAKASGAFQQVVNHYSLAQIWDPQGWFWSPVEAITNDFVLRDSAHYGWVVPQVFAESSRVGKQPY